MKERDPTEEDMLMILKDDGKHVIFEGWSRDTPTGDAEFDYDLDFKFEKDGKRYILHTSWILMIELEEGDNPENF
jgi:hypothetical protein